VLFCVMCDICEFCLIVVPRPPGKTPFSVKINKNITNHNNIRLHAALCGYETSSSSVRERHNRLGIMTKQFLRRIFGLEVEEIKSECGQIQGENLYVRRIRGSEYVART
jgi:hypothetical protein